MNAVEVNKVDTIPAIAFRVIFRLQSGQVAETWNDVLSRGHFSFWSCCRRAHHIQLVASQLISVIASPPAQRSIPKTKPPFFTELWLRRVENNRIHTSSSLPYFRLTLYVRASVLIQSSCCVMAML